MKISTKVMNKIVFSIVMLFLLAPLTVFAQDGFYVIPVSVNKPLKNVITVAKANGKFTDPVAAVNSITDYSATNPYLVVIGPGVYTITHSLVMKPYVDIAGSGENVTKITGAISSGNLQSSATVSGANNSALSSLTVENTGGGANSIALYNYGASPRVNNITAKASGGGQSFGVFNSASSPLMTNVTATASGGTGSYGVFNSAYSSPSMTNITATASGGTGSYGVYNSYSSPTMTGVTATASGGERIFGVYNDASSPLMTNVTAAASGGTESHGVFNNASSSPGMTSITATASGGTLWNFGVYNVSSSPTMRGVTATASGGIGSYGVRNDNSSPTMTDVTATGTGNFGVSNISSSPVIRRSTMNGGIDGLNTSDGTATVSQSTIINGAGGSTNKCVACDNGSGTALGAGCN